MCSSDLLLGGVIDLLTKKSGIRINTIVATAAPSPTPQGVFKIPRSGFRGGWMLIFRSELEVIELVLPTRESGTELELLIPVAGRMIPAGEIKLLLCSAAAPTKSETDRKACSTSVADW